MEIEEVNALYISAASMLTIEPGAQLIVNERIEVYNEANLRWKGCVSLKNDNQQSINALAEPH